MLIPSIDLMGGKIVQLVQGEKKALEFDDFEPWLERFSRYPLVQLIDLDAAIGSGRQPRRWCALFFDGFPCQVGGGIRTVETSAGNVGGRRLAGDHRVVARSRMEAFNVHLPRSSPVPVGADKLIFAVDSKGGKVAVRGWRQLTEISATPNDSRSRGLVRWLSIHPH